MSKLLPDGLLERSRKTLHRFGASPVWRRLSVLLMTLLVISLLALAFAVSRHAAIRPGITIAASGARSMGLRVTALLDRAFVSTADLLFPQPDGFVAERPKARAGAPFAEDGLGPRPPSVWNVPKSAPSTSAGQSEPATSQPRF